MYVVTLSLSTLFFFFFVQTGTSTFRLLIRRSKALVTILMQFLFLHATFFLPTLFSSPLLPLFRTPIQRPTRELDPTFKLLFQFYIFNVYSRSNHPHIFFMVYSAEIDFDFRFDNEPPPKDFSMQGNVCRLAKFAPIYPANVHLSEFKFLSFLPFFSFAPFDQSKYTIYQCGVSTIQNLFYTTKRTLLGDRLLQKLPTLFPIRFKVKCCDDHLNFSYRWKINYQQFDSINFC